MFNLSRNQYHITHNLKHYEDGFKPQSLYPTDNRSMTEFRLSAFTATVYRKATKAESRIRFEKKYESESNKREMSQTKDDYVKYRFSKLQDGGYRAYKNVIGLEDSGYIDIDEVKEDSAGIKPTQENVSKALQAKNIFNIVFRSGSNDPHKLRLLYKRGFKLYYKDSYDPETQVWNLDEVYTTKPKILSTNPEVFETSRSSMTNVINSILYQELTYITSILADAGINTSGIDPTSCNAHMHSAHCIRQSVIDAGEEYPEPTMYLEGAAL